MRLGLVIYGSLDTLSGGYLYDRQLVRHLLDAGDRVEIVSLPWRNYGRHLGDNAARALYRRLADLPVDLLLQDELNHPSLVGINHRLRRRMCYPMVSIVHHLRSSENHPQVLRRLYREIERLYLNSVDGFVYNSRTTRDAVELLLSRAKPGVIALPAADHLSPPAGSDMAELMQERSLCSGPLRILFVGNVIGRKGLHELVAALALLSRENWHLSVVGSLDVEPAYARRIRQQVQSGGLGDRITLHGAVSRSTLQEQLRISHLLAVPSYEGFGIVYLEAMAFGLPVLASTMGAAGEIVTQDVDGWLVAPGDLRELSQRIAVLVRDRDRLLSMAQAARARYDRHPSWGDSMAVARQWLDELVQSCAGATAP